MISRYVSDLQLALCQGDKAVNVHPDGIMSELGPPKTKKARVFLVYCI